MSYDEGYRESPVEVGDEVNVKIESVGEKGDGLARVNGFILFVPGVKAGQEVRIRVTKVLRKVGFAEVVGSKSKESAQSGDQNVQEEFVQEVPEDTEDFGE